MYGAQYYGQVGYIERTASVAMSPQTLSLPNYERINLPQEPTHLESDTPANTTPLSVENNSGFNVGDFFILGTLASETSELLAVGGVGGNMTITPTAPTGFGHTSSEPLTKLLGSQIRIWRAPDTIDHTPPTQGFTVLDTINIQVNQNYTLYTDPEGGNGFWYAFSYFNPNTGAQSSPTFDTPVRGGNLGNYCSIEDIRSEAGFTYSPFITNDMINKKRLAAQNEIDSVLSSAFTVPFAAPIPAMISDICVRLAAGLLLQEKYSYSSNPDTNGTNKLTEARADLMKLQTGNTPVVDANGKNIGLPNPNTSASGWPNDTTANSDPNAGGAPRAFRMSMVQGYYSRDF